MTTIIYLCVQKYYIPENNFCQSFTLRTQICLSVTLMGEIASKKKLSKSISAFCQEIIIYVK